MTGAQKAWSLTGSARAVRRARFMLGGLGRAITGPAATTLLCAGPAGLRNGRGAGPGAVDAVNSGNPAWRHPVTDPDTSRHIEIKDGDQMVAAAEVTTSPEADGTAEASLYAASGHIAPGSRASLVDAVMDLPEVAQSARLKAAVPLGDTESLWRLRERTDDTVTRAAGSTALVDANIPADDEPESGQEPDGETPVP